MDGLQTRTEWDELLALRDAGGGASPPPEGPLAALFAPLLAPPAAEDGCLVVGRLAQTLDGRIATLSGSSQWIGGRGDILHTHRLRALCHAVVVGAGTVRHDDPLLTTRECEGPDPVRVVLDTDRRLGPDRRVFAEGGPPTLLVCAEDAAGPDRLDAAEVVRLPRRVGKPAMLSRSFTVATPPTANRSRRSLVTAIAMKAPSSMPTSAAAWRSWLDPRAPAAAPIAPPRAAASIAPLLRTG